MSDIDERYYKKHCMPEKFRILAKTDNIDNKTRAALELGRIKPYAVCYGGMFVKPEYDKRLRREH